MTVPPVEFTLLKSCRPPRGSFSEADLRTLAAFVLGAEHVRGPVQLSLDLTNPKRIHELNRRFRGVDRTTDVISFRDDLNPHPSPLPRREREKKPSPVLGEGAEGRMRGTFQGDIAINVNQAALQAKQVGHPLHREVRLLWIHGLLHLLGYTDYAPVPRRKMFKRQNELLRRWEKKTGT